MHGFVSQTSQLYAIIDIVKEQHSYLTTVRLSRTREGTAVQHKTVQITLFDSYVNLSFILAINMSLTMVNSKCVSQTDPSTAVIIYQSNLPGICAWFRVSD